MENLYRDTNFSCYDFAPPRGIIVLLFHYVVTHPDSIGKWSGNWDIFKLAYLEVIECDLRAGS